LYFGNDPKSANEPERSFDRRDRRINPARADAEKLCKRWRFFVAYTRPRSGPE
jgi:hypothetical protein